MSISIVRNYWHNLWQSTLRVILIFGIVLVTGLVLSNQDADTEVKFPTDIPPLNDTINGALFLLAACYQADSSMGKTLHESFGGPNELGNALLRDSPNNHIRGWGFYLAMLVWYLLALLVTYVRRFYHIFRKYGAWVAIGRALIPICSSSWVPEEEGDSGDRRNKFFKWLHTIYMLCGVALGSATAITSANFNHEIERLGTKIWLAGNGPNKVASEPGGRRNFLRTTGANSSHFLDGIYGSSDCQWQARPFYSVIYNF